MASRLGAVTVVIGCCMLAGCTASNSTESDEMTLPDRAAAAGRLEALLELTVTSTPHVRADGLTRQKTESELSCDEVTAQLTRWAEIRLEPGVDMESTLTQLGERLHADTGWPVRTSRSLADGLSILSAEDDDDRSGVVVGQESDDLLHVTAYSPCYRRQS